jgi:hypothetical protein
MFGDAFHFGTESFRFVPPRRTERHFSALFGTQRHLWALFRTGFIQKTELGAVWCGKVPFGAEPSQQSPDRLKPGHRTGCCTKVAPFLHRLAGESGQWRPGETR